MAQKETVERILDAASALFAERGYAETSLRTITTSAGVNLAAVNYHFGSKKSLIQAVFARVLQPFCEELADNLDVLEETSRAGSKPIQADELFRTIFYTLLKAFKQSHCDEDIDGKTQADKSEQVIQLQQFMRLLGMAYTQSQGHLRRFIVREYGEVYRRFIALLRSTVPHVNPIDFYWQLYFLLGAAVFTLSSIDSIQGIIFDNFGQHSEVERAIELLVPTLSRMMQLPDSSLG